MSHEKTWHGPVATSIHRRFRSKVDLLVGESRNDLVGAEVSKFRRVDGLEDLLALLDTQLVRWNRPRPMAPIYAATVLTPTLNRSHAQSEILAR